ncbi:50S ribosomal protein L16 [Candidatus Parcubacteria bacterium]|jgi:large subunit ribosomal protein L16|nr:MAG: 50S ribosomal protein L16 [Candidatus Parcubacteria bacterium]
MLTPKKVKHRKHHRGRISGFATQKTNLSFGAFGLKVMEAGWVSARQIEAARRAITRLLHRGGKIWIRVFPDKAVTIKGSEIRMGGGKGPVDHYVAVVKPGTIMFELDGITPALAKEALDLAAYKLSVKTKFIAKI